MIVLAGPSADKDPHDGHFELVGPIHNLPDHQWQIDGTVFWINKVLYFVYSGWPLDGRPESEKTQQLFIVRMADPVTAEGHPVLISDPGNHWERSGDAGKQNDGAICELCLVTNACS
jgi:GH43 family beta-xylosidase